MNDVSTEDFHYEGDDLEVLADVPNYQEWIIGSFQDHLSGRVLEVGAGLGTMSERIRPRVSQLDLVEPSTNLVGVLQRKFADDAGVSVHNQFMEDFLDTTADETYDAIVMINVLEHIQDDETTLRRCYQALKPGGTLYVYVPALQWLYSRLDAKLGHYRRYGKKALNAVVVDAGFAVADIRYFDVLGVLPWWLINTVGGSTGFNPAMVRLYDRVGVPLTKAFEGIVSPPLGKNVYVLAHKPR